MSNFGSAIAPGAGSAIQEAMARRSSGAPVMAQQSAMSPSAVPMGTPPQSNALPPTQSVPQSQPSPMGSPMDAEAKTIISALSSRLKDITNLQRGPQL